MRYKSTIGLVAIATLIVACWGRKAASPKKSFTRVELAKSFLIKGELDQATVEARKSIAFDASNEQAYNVLGLVEFLRAHHNHRMREVQDCLTGVDADALREDFDTYLYAAAGYFEKAAKLDPDYGEAVANRGKVAVHLDEFDRAITYFQLALEKPNRLSNIGLTRSDLGWAYFHQDQQVRAAKHLRMSLQFQPNMCVSTYRLGRVYFARKEWQKALEKFQAVTADPGCPLQEAHLYLIMTYRTIGTPVSTPTVKQCVQLAPNSCLASRCRSVASREIDEPPSDDGGFATSASR